MRRERVELAKLVLEKATQRRMRRRGVGSQRTEAALLLVVLGGGGLQCARRCRERPVSFGASVSLGLITYPLRLAFGLAAQLRHSSRGLVVAGGDRLLSFAMQTIQYAF